MLDWQQRVVEEKEALDEKLVKLNEFMLQDNPTFTGLDPAERALLRKQRSGMEFYSMALAGRIERFN